MVDDVGQVWKKCPRLMIRGTEIACTGSLVLGRVRQLKRSLAFLNLEFPLKTFYWVLRDYEEGGKSNESQAVGKWQIQIEGRELAPLNCLKGQPKGESTEKLAWKFKLDHCFMSKTLKKEGPSICARKTCHAQSHSPAAVATTESTLLDAELETFAPKVACVSTQNVPWLFPNENIWLWVKQAVYTNGLVAKKTDKIESDDKISSQVSLKTCTKRNFTHQAKT